MGPLAADRIFLVPPYVCVKSGDDVYHHCDCFEVGNASRGPHSGRSVSSAASRSEWLFATSRQGLWQDIGPRQEGGTRQEPGCLSACRIGRSLALKGSTALRVSKRRKARWLHGEMLADRSRPINSNQTPLNEARLHIIDSLMLLPCSNR